MHSNLVSLARLCCEGGIRLTLLTAGLLLERYAEDVTRWMDDVIVSLDGPPGVHDAIRSVPGAFVRLAEGIRAIKHLRPQMPVHGRCTVQKSNFRNLRDTVRAAYTLGLDSISFLAVDITSEAFNRPLGWLEGRRASIALDSSEVEALDLEIEALILDCRREIESDFVCESPEKLRRVAQHFRANLGQLPAVAPRCDAPWVSTVVEADGTVRPCFFHRPIGNIRERNLTDILNSKVALDFRRRLDVANNPVCQSCVCSLSLKEKALEF